MFDKAEYRYTRQLLERQAHAGRDWGTDSVSLRLGWPRLFFRHFLPWWYVNIADAHLAVTFFARRRPDLVDSQRLSLGWSSAHQRRFRQWLRHIATYAVLHPGAGGSTMAAPPSWLAGSPVGMRRPQSGWRDEASTRAACRPQVVWPFFEHQLDVVEKKNASLLVLNSALLAVAGVIAPAVWRSPHWILLPVYAVIAGVTIFVLLRAALRVRWGELGGVDAPEDAWQAHLDEMIHALITRTARFRLATLFTLLSIGGLLTCLWAASKVAPSQPSGAPPPPAALETATEAQSVEFGLGEACGGPHVRSVLASLTAHARERRWSAVHLHAGADVIPTRQGSRFGNNVGLALERAECVAGALVVGVPGLRVTTTLRDAGDRNPAATDGSAADRRVHILAHMPIQSQ